MDSVPETTPRQNQDSSEQSVGVNRSDFIIPTNKINTKTNKKIEASTHDSVVKKAIRALNEEEDQYEIFGKYVASEMRSLSSEYLRKKMKRKFQQIILDTNEEDEQISSPSQSYSNPSSVSSVHAYLDSTSSPQQYINQQATPTVLYIQTDRESQMTLPRILSGVNESELHSIISDATKSTQEDFE